MGKENKPDNRTPEEILADARLEAQAIRDEALMKAAAIASGQPGSVAPEKSKLTPNPDFNMEDKGFTKYDLIKLKVLKGAKHHKADTFLFENGEPAEILIQRGYAEFVEVAVKAQKNDKGHWKYAKREVPKQPLPPGVRISQA